MTISFWRVFFSPLGIVEWHPSVQNVLLSAGFDYMLIVWNTATGRPLKEISCHTDTIYRSCMRHAMSISFMLSSGARIFRKIRF